MCRSIKQLRKIEGMPSEEEIQAAALQFIRKISGFQKPSRRNQPAFEKAVAGVVDVSRKLLHDIAAPPEMEMVSGEDSLL